MHCSAVKDETNFNLQRFFASRSPDVVVCVPTGAFGQAQNCLAWFFMICD